ncbi:MAG: nucleotidyltransferase family protein [Nocardioidaceae bacterium]
MLSVAGVVVDEQRLAIICERFGVAELLVFGSAARDDLHHDSDIDVLYTLRPGSRLGWNIEQLSDELTELFGRPVDLVSRQALHPRLKEAVLSEAWTMYAA